MSIVTRFVSFITRKKAVWLKDCDGEVVMSIEVDDPFGNGKRAKRKSLIEGDKYVNLNPDGTCSGVSYVSEWAYVTPIKNFWKIFIASAVVCAMIASCSVRFSANIVREDCPVVVNSK